MPSCYDKRKCITTLFYIDAFLICLIMQECFSNFFQRKYNFTVIRWDWFFFYLEACQAIFLLWSSEKIKNFNHLFTCTSFNFKYKLSSMLIKSFKKVLVLFFQ